MFINKDEIYPYYYVSPDDTWGVEVQMEDSLLEEVVAFKKYSDEIQLKLQELYNEASKTPKN